MSYEEEKDGPNGKKPGGNNPKKNFWTPLIIALALVLLFGVGGEICSYQVALYQILWVIPAVFITRLYVTKN